MKRIILIGLLTTGIILISGCIQQPEINFDTLKNCTLDEQCIIINSLNKCPYCDRDDICGNVDYSLDKYIAVNSELFSKWQSENCPSKGDCLQKYGPLPLCEARPVNINFVAKCVENICKKVAK